MNENWAYIKENIERFPEYKSSIFEQGFLITNQNLTIRDAFPFFRNWRQEILSDSFHIFILRTLAEQALGFFDLVLQTINELSCLVVLGMIAGERITFCGDFESMRTAYYGNIDGHFYLCSHEELVSLFEQLHRDDYVTKLEHYRWYHLYGEGLPGDISHYQ